MAEGAGVDVSASRLRRFLSNEKKIVAGEELETIAQFSLVNRAGARPILGIRAIDSVVQRISLAIQSSSLCVLTL